MSIRPFLGVLLLVGPCLGFSCNRSPNDNSKPEFRLRYKLFCEIEYDPRVRPVENIDHTIRVNMSLDMKYISIDEYSNQFSISAWVVTTWFDSELKWNPTDYGIDRISVSSSLIWVPDLSVFNADSSQFFMLDGAMDCVLISSGKVRCAHDLRAPMYCDMQLQRWPFDTQNCNLLVGSWAYNGNSLDVAIMGRGINTYAFTKSNEWEMISSKSIRKAYTFSNVSYPYLQFDFELKRHAALFAASIVGPAFVLAGLVVISFLMNGLTVRCVVCCTAMLGNALFLQYVGFHLPADGDTSPYIVAFYRDSLILTLAAVVISTLVEHMRAAGDGGFGDLCGGEAPQWLVGAASFVRGRGGRAGQLLLGEHDAEKQADEDMEDVLTPRESERRGIPRCSMFATFIDRTAFLVFSIVYSILLFALVP
ncbi:neuronal acetylcholine receptor subunit alpha-5-like [Cloeon dipterum]|uniref:neuronal acetylcholine receptor subunit alpha-5-like n=1 Tax=Cloeon dipterum TaxID=197152 RepID=UPI00321F7961